MSALHCEDIVHIAWVKGMVPSNLTFPVDCLFAASSGSVKGSRELRKVANADVPKISKSVSVVP